MVSSKITTIGVALGSTLGVTASQVPQSLHSTNEIVVYLFTVGLSTLLLSFLGALLGTLIGDPIKPKSKMWAIFIASALSGAMASTLFAKVDVLNDIPSQVLGFFVSLFSRWVIPAIIDVIPGFFQGLKDRVLGMIGRAK